MARVHSRVVCEVRRADLRRVTRVFGGSGVVLFNESRVHRLGDLEWEPTSETLRGALDGVLASVGGQGFLALHAQVEGAVAAGPAHCLLWCDGAIHPHLAGTDAGRGITEDVALLKETVSIQGYILGGSECLISILTARTFTTLTIMARTPAEMIIRQKVMPMVSWVMALVFRLPSVATPRIIMIPPRE